ncbi:lysylphosphatidylglycerol synthase transmembrane domain-containing protein [Granulicella cerasi]|uniref:Lysylphosphatidylglycerol synthase transmembrane domain-containing protein n=1 Tax=Granulicella cerasi TaxID=741063 RepID=A0ABW1ZGY7_9BACT|nr:lysylphosphatidylglycerol synthase transmembrane domain-containing protein [Granulicella cerasi]
MTRDRVKSLLKVVPGFAVSAFFIWWTYIRKHPDGTRGFDPHVFKSIHVTSWVWVVAVIGFTILGYGTRCFRWWMMLRPMGSKFSTCSRVLMTSLAANNILPLRIGDIMRVFTYAPDLGVSPTSVLSTVIIEKLLDVFTLAVLVMFTMHFGQGVSPHAKLVAELCVAISAGGLLVLIFGARHLHAPVQKLATKTQNGIVGKIEHYLGLAIDCIEKIGIFGSLMLIVYSFIAWGFEGVMYVSAAKMIGLATDWVGPWQAVAEANLSFLIPSSPGGIGPFELACQDALVRHGANVKWAATYGLLMHVWLLASLTSVGGAMFFIHRARRALRKPLMEEVEALPTATEL